MSMSAEQRRERGQQAGAAMNLHTSGPWEVRSLIYGDRVVAPKSERMIARLPELCDTLATAAEVKANGLLIAEAGTVATETGLTPRQLAEQRSELLEALRNSPCFCEDADGDDDAITCDRCAAIAKCGVKL